MIRRVRVVRGPEVVEWLESPHKERRRADRLRARYLRAEQIIEQAGTLAGEDYLKKLPAYGALWETRVDDHRVFSTVLASNVLMVVVVEKKKQRLSASQLRTIESRVRRFAETWREENQSG